MMRARAFTTALLLLSAGCAVAPHATAPKGSFWQRGQCHSLAESRLGLYMNSDIYPLNDKERQDALSALYNECMKQYGVSPPAPKQAMSAPPPVAEAPPPPPAPVQNAPLANDIEVEHHRAVAAPVPSVTMGNTSTSPVAPPPPVPTTPVTPPAAAPFAPAIPPSPALAAKIHRPPVAKRAPGLPPPSPDDNGKSQLESILNQQ
jgi:hypothetical protein